MGPNRPINSMMLAVLTCVQVNIRLLPEEAELLCEKYTHEDFPELVNYVAFSHTVDPPLEQFETYV